MNLFFTPPDIAILTLVTVIESTLFILLLLICRRRWEKKWQKIDESRQQVVAECQAKTAYLSIVSHEIRTPLHAIRGLLERQIKENIHPHHPQPLVEVAHNAAENLLAMTGDMLDFSRIESGRLSIKPQDEELISLTRSVVSLFSVLAEQKQLILRLRVEGVSTCRVLIDPCRYKQILTNLLSNAIKFTHKGAINVVLRHTMSSAGVINVSLSVQDSGCGIAFEDQQKLFRPFMQVNTTSETAWQGAGLGLFICRTLCELMQGELRLESAPGVGTSVHIQLSLPSGQVESPVMEKHISPEITPVSGKRVLIADDYAPNLLLLRYQLESLGHQVSEANDGAAALDLWRKHRNYDYILIDCNMPVMDGFTFSQKVRQEERQTSGSCATILGFTASSQTQEIIEQCLAAGMDGCLFKPCTQVELSERII